MLPRLKISGSACWWFPAWFLFRENFGELRQTVLFSSVPFRFCIHQLIVSSRDQSKSQCSQIWATTLALWPHTEAAPTVEESDVEEDSDR